LSYRPGQIFLHGVQIVEVKDDPKCKTIHLDFVHHLNYKIINYYVSEAGFCFRLHVKKGRKRAEGLSDGQPG
jgi:hypothetical protein